MTALKGKDRRFFRTVKQKFLPTLRLSEIENIEHLDNLFDRWLSNGYHKDLHHGINDMPIVTILGTWEDKGEKFI